MRRFIGLRSIAAVLGASLLCAMASGMREASESPAEYRRADGPPIAGPRRSIRRRRHHRAATDGRRGRRAGGSGASPCNPQAAARSRRRPRTDGSGGTSGGAPESRSRAGQARCDDHVPPCIDDPNDVVMIGDSYIDWITHTFVDDLRAESGQQWPSYAIGGTSIGDRRHRPDPRPARHALAANTEIKAIVMTGGGNDILVADTRHVPRRPECARARRPRR